MPNSIGIPWEFLENFQEKNKKKTEKIKKKNQNFGKKRRF